MFASVEALINAYRAYNQVLADPTLPWFAKIPAAVGVLAAGMKTVQSIKGLSGGSGGGSTGAPSGVSGSTQQAPQRQAIVEIRGPDWIQNLVQPMVEEIYEQTRDGTRVIFTNGN